MYIHDVGSAQKLFYFRSSRRIELVGNLSTDEKAELFKAATTSEIEQLLGLMD